ncbi:MAG: hypothetical protein WA821_18565 [Anaerolineales bacterium]
MAGRPKATALSVVIRAVLTLREGEDDDLIAVFQQVPARKRAAYIKTALRSGGMKVEIDDLPDDDDLIVNLDDFLS